MRIAVVGGGLIGLASAYYLTQRGVDVIVLERKTLATEASYGNGGLIVPSFCQPIASPEAPRQYAKWSLHRNSPIRISFGPNRRRYSWIVRFWQACRSGMFPEHRRLLKALGDASFALFEGLADKKGFDFHFEKKGVVEAYQSEKKFQAKAEHAAKLRSLGYESQTLTAPELHELEPGLNRDIVGGILYPKDAQANPILFAKCLAEASKSNGAVISEQTDVIGFEIKNQTITGVKTNSGILPCDFVLLAAGPWSPDLARQLGKVLPIEPGKGYMVTLQGMKRRLRTAVEVPETRVMITQKPDGNLRVVGAMEFVGFDRTIPRQRISWILTQVHSVIPDTIHSEVLEQWCGFRPCLPDGLPALGLIDGLENLCLATGHCRLGFTLSPITGKLISELILDGTASLPIGDFDPNRFSK